MIQAVIFDLGHTLMHLQSTWPQVFERGVADLAAFLAERAPEIDGPACARLLLERRAEGFARAKETQREVTATIAPCRRRWLRPTRPSIDWTNCPAAWPACESPPIYHRGTEDTENRKGIA